MENLLNYASHKELWCNILVATLLHEQLLKDLLSVQPTRFGLFNYCISMNDYSAWEYEKPYARCIYPDHSKVDILGFWPIDESKSDYTLICKHYNADGTVGYQYKKMSELMNFGCRRIIRGHIHADFSLRLALNTRSAYQAIDGCFLSCIRKSFHSVARPGHIGHTYFTDVFNGDALWVSMEYKNYDTLDISVTNNGDSSAQNSFFMESCPCRNTYDAEMTWLNSSYGIDSDCSYTITI